MVFTSSSFMTGRSGSGDDGGISCSVLDVEDKRFEQDGGEGGRGAVVVEVEASGDGDLGVEGATLGGVGGFGSGDGACTGGVLGVTSIAGASGALGLTGGGGGMAPSAGLISGATGRATAISSAGFDSTSSVFSSTCSSLPVEDPGGFLLMTLVGVDSPGTRFAFSGLGSG